MLNSAEARAQAATAMEANKKKAEQEAKAAEARAAKLAKTANDLVEKKIAAAVKEAADEGLMSLAINIEKCEQDIAERAIETISQRGFDVAISANTSTEDAPGRITFTLYWSKDRGGNPGNVTRPKTVDIA